MSDKQLKLLGYLLTLFEKTFYDNDEGFYMSFTKIRYLIRFELGKLQDKEQVCQKSLPL